jgi:hypothetical protein
VNSDKFEKYSFSHNFLGNFWRLVALSEEKECEEITDSVIEKVKAAERHFTTVNNEWGLG